MMLWPYIDRCVPFQIPSNQLNLPQVDSNQVVETSQGWSMETGCTWAQLSLIAKGLNTYVNKVYVYGDICFFIWNYLAKNVLNLCLFCHNGVLCVDWWVMFLFFIRLRIRL
jgi:hypothetical protein